MATVTSYTKAQLDTLLAAKAALASAALTGTPTSTTPATNDNTTRIATTAWVVAQGYGTGSGTTPDASTSTKGIVQLAGDLTGTAANPTLASILTAGTVGSATAIPVVTYDAKGRITAVATATASDPTRAPEATRYIIDTGRMDSSGTGQSSVGTIGRAWTMADAANTSIGGTIDLPASWNTYNVDIWSTAVAASTGNVTILYQPAVLAAGFNLTTTSTTLSTTVITPSATAFVLTKDRIASGITVDHSGPTYIKIARSGNDAADTCTIALALVRIDVTRAS